MKIINKNKYILFFILFFILELSGITFLANWREWFWDSVSNKDVIKFWYYLLEFGIVALLLCFVSGYKSFILNILGLVYRTTYTRKSFNADIKHIEGHQQRIQQDCGDYPALTLQLVSGFGMSLCQILIYMYIIIEKVSINLLLISLVYIIIGTLISSKIAKPLIKLNYDNQVYEANFRQTLRKKHYGKVYRNNWLVFKNLKYLNYFQSFFNQITVLIPLLLLAHSYFIGLLTFGVLMQLSNCLGSVIDNGAYFINSFDMINKWLSCKKRLKEIGII